MKTPQEEAEEWVKRIDKDHLYSDWRYNREELKNLIERILNESGRAELIAVARAAVEMLSDLQTFGSGDLDYEWEKALQALRATGKVKL